MKPILKLAACIFLVEIVMFISCKKETNTINKPPIAKAGRDQAITLPVDSVSLDGSASVAPDGKINEWLWTKISGPASFVIGNTTTAKTVVKNLVTGFYQFELKVSDDEGLPAKDTVQITVNRPNRPPVANAGPDVNLTYSCSSPGFINLDGSGSSDPDYNISSYLWTKISGPAACTLSDNTSAIANAGNLIDGLYGFELKVTDAGGLSSKDTVLVTVKSASVEYNLDAIANGSFTFIDNYEDCYYYRPCSYYDYVSIQGRFSFPPLGEFTLYASEYADTAVSGNYATNMSFYTGNGNGPLARGTCSVDFRELVEKGGGSFSGTFTVDGGSAQGCNQNIYTNLPPLTVTGNMDTAAHTISMSIKGKIYF